MLLCPYFFMIAPEIESYVNFLSLVWKYMVLALNRRMNDDSLRESYATKHLSIPYAAFYES